MSSFQHEPYAAAVRKLLKGAVYYDDLAWIQIRDYELPLREYFGQIGLGLHLDEIGGFAYLYDESRDDDNQKTLPPLTDRRPLNLSDTLLLVLLRERLDEHEMRDLDRTKLILSRDELIEMLGVFVMDHPDARKIEQNSQASINRLVKYGFLTLRHDESFEVRPLLRAKISTDELEDIKTRLIRHLRQKNKQIGDIDDEPI